MYLLLYQHCQCSILLFILDIRPGPVNRVEYVGQGVYYHGMTGDFVGIVKVDLPTGKNVRQLDKHVCQSYPKYNVVMLDFNIIYEPNFYLFKMFF